MLSRGEGSFPLTCWWHFVYCSLCSTGSWWPSLLWGYIADSSSEPGSLPQSWFPAIFGSYAEQFLLCTQVSLEVWRIRCDVGLRGDLVIRFVCLLQHACAVLQAAEAGCIPHSSSIWHLQLAWEPYDGSWAWLQWPAREHGARPGVNSKCSVCSFTQCAQEYTSLVPHWAFSVAGSFVPYITQKCELVPERI